jgi:hypothetical protein
MLRRILERWIDVLVLIETPATDHAAELAPPPHLSANLGWYSTTQSVAVHIGHWVPSRLCRNKVCCDSPAVNAQSDGARAFAD